MPSSLATATEATLLEEAYVHRPDYAAARVERERAAASVALAKRLRFPEVQLSMQYTQTGTGQLSLQPPTATIGLTFVLPALYQFQGEIKRAETDAYLASVNTRKLEAVIATDVAVGYEAWATQRKLVERMQAEVLRERRRRAT